MRQGTALTLLLALVIPSALLAGPLEYRPGGFQFSLERVARTAEHVEYIIRFPSPLKSGFKANDTVWGHLMVPAQASAASPKPCVLVLPVMAAPNIWIESWFIRRLAKDGFAVLWLEMPYQFHRRPSPLEPSGQVFLARTARRLAFNFRQSVLDARRALDWLSHDGTAEGVDGSRIGIFGISLGSLVGAAVECVDLTPKYAVFLLGGADFPSLVEHSSMTSHFIRRAGISLQQLTLAWKGLDPLDYAGNNSGKKVLLVNASQDSVIPRANALALKKAFPSARQMWVPLGHYSSIVHLIWLPRYVGAQFSRSL